MHIQKNFVLIIILLIAAAIFFTALGSSNPKFPKLQSDIPPYEGPDSCGGVTSNPKEDNHCLLYALALMNAHNYYGATSFQDPHTIAILARLERAVRVAGINVDDGADAQETRQIIMIKRDEIMPPYLDDNPPTTGPTSGNGGGNSNGGGGSGGNSFPPEVFGNNWDPIGGTPTGTNPLAQIDWTITGPAFIVNLIRPSWSRGHLLTCVANPGFNCQTGVGSITCTEHPNQGGGIYNLNINPDGTFSGTASTYYGPPGGTFTGPTFSGSVVAAFGEVP